MISAYNELAEPGLAPQCVEYQQELNEKKKRMYLEILYSNPAGFRLTARMTTNYRQLKTIYKQRRTHRLPEWQAVCDWIETLPHSELIVGDEAARPVTEKVELTPEGVLFR